LKDFEVLQKTDPEAALRQLEQLERTRAEERVSLRHRSTGQWARNKAVRAKYNKEVSIIVQHHLSILKIVIQPQNVQNVSMKTNYSKSCLIWIQTSGKFLLARSDN
jgi:U3 small nucleolar RNA-associated protein 14